jgi:hypothetical protein
MSSWDTIKRIYILVLKEGYRIVQIQCTQSVVHWKLVKKGERTYYVRLNSYNCDEAGSGIE